MSPADMFVSARGKLVHSDEKAPTAARKRLAEAAATATGAVEAAILQDLGACER